MTTTLLSLLLFGVAAPQPPAGSPRPEAATALPPSHEAAAPLAPAYIVTGDGVRIAYRLEGPGDRPVLILANSIGTTLHIYIVFRAGRDGWYGQEFDQFIYKSLIILMCIFEGILPCIGHVSFSLRVCKMNSSLYVRQQLYCRQDAVQLHLKHKNLRCGCRDCCLIERPACH